MRLLPALLFVGVAFAGCADESAPSQACEDDPFGCEGPGATDSTGLIRGVVVDDAIVPLANVTITIYRGADVVAAIQSDPQGRFIWPDLEPGTYRIEATRPGHETAVAHATVEAGEDRPPVVRLVLTRIPGFEPFYNQFTWAGYIQCNTTYANLCLIINYYPDFVLGTGPVTDDESYYTFYEEFVDVRKHPTHTQVETAWDSTQLLGENLVIRYQGDRPDTLLIDCPYGPGGSVDSPSPQTFVINASKAREMGLGAASEDDDPDDNCDPTEANGLGMEFFAGDTVGQCQDVPAVGCHPRIGVALEQRTETFVHAFYDYAPPEDWRFVDGEGVPPPPA